MTEKRALIIFYLFFTVGFVSAEPKEVKLFSYQSRNLWLYRYLPDVSLTFELFSPQSVNLSQRAVEASLSKTQRSKIEAGFIVTLSWDFAGFFIKDSDRLLRNIYRENKRDYLFQLQKKYMKLQKNVPLRWELEGMIDFLVERESIQSQLKFIQTAF